MTYYEMLLAQSRDSRAERFVWGPDAKLIRDESERATICEECGSGILDGEHIADYPCSRRDGGGA